MHLSLWSMSIFVTCLPIFATVCRCPGLLCSGDIQKQSNGQGGIGVAFLFKPLDLDSGMAWNGYVWRSGAEMKPTFSGHRPSSCQCLSSRGAMGQPQKDQKCWNDLILLCILFVQNLGPKQPWRWGGVLTKGCSMSWKRGRYCTAMYSPLSEQGKSS